jgi:glutamyl-tRNA synthetase
VTTRPRVRIAPSPTGYFHVGTARTALFNWLFARQRGGAFLVRIEDTDAARNRPEHVEGILRALRWLGLDWDEEPVFQSQRIALYDEAVAKLLAAGYAYHCECSAGCDGHCREAGLGPAPTRMVRFRAPREGETVIEDVVRGRVSVDNATIEDFGLRKSTGGPFFYLANTVDDSAMAITHVIRGEEHLTNTAKYVLLWQALGYGELPVFAHLPLLLNDKRQKLSKRRDKVALEDYRDAGFLPEAVRNYLGLLGWSPPGDREIVTLEEMLEEFRLEDVKSAGAIFDERKLGAVNSEYLRALPVGELVERAAQWQRSRWEPIAALVQERARTLADVYEMTDFLYLPSLRLDSAEWDKAVASGPAFGAVLAAAARHLEDLEDWTAGAIREAIAAAGADAGVDKLARSQAPVRLAVTGRSVGPPLWESLELLGRQRTLARLAEALERLEK